MISKDEAKLNAPLQVVVTVFRIEGISLASLQEPIYLSTAGCIYSIVEGCIFNICFV